MGKIIFVLLIFFFFLLYYFWLNQCIFILGDSDRQRGCTTSAVQCKEKKNKDPTFGRKVPPSTVCCFCFYPPFPKLSGSKRTLVCFQSLLCNYTTFLLSLWSVYSRRWRYRFSHRRGPTFYCMLVALRLHFC